MISISLCMIVKNEEAVIGRCLDSIRGIADEINIVDTGSVDQTKDIVSVIQTGFLILNGLTILQQPEIFRFSRPRPTIFYGLMPTTCLPRKIKSCYWI